MLNENPRFVTNHTKLLYRVIVNYVRGKRFCVFSKRLEILTRISRHPNYISKELIYSNLHPTKGVQAAIHMDRIWKNPKPEFVFFGAVTFGEFTLTNSWSRALLEKLPIVQLLKNFPAFYGTRRYIIVFTRSLHWSLSSAR
jgi:hypothetical protein